MSAYPKITRETYGNEIIPNITRGHEAAHMSAGLGAERCIDMERTKIYEAINSERDYQDQKWGTPKEHPHEVGGYITLMRNLLNRAEKAWAESSSNDTALAELRKTVAVGVACFEQHGVSRRINAENTQNVGE